MSNDTDSPQILSRFRGALISVGIFSFFFNLLVLTLPLYMLSVFTRVLSSKSEETLVLLTIAAITALGIQALLDIIRSRLMARIGMGLDEALTPQALEVVVRHAAGTGSRNNQPLQDASELRGFLSGSGVFSLFDAPFAPLYVAVIYLLHPVLGTMSLVGALILFGIAFFSELGARKTLRSISAHNQKNQGRIEEFVRNSDAVEAMGMMPNVLRRWRAHAGYGVGALSDAADRGTLAKSLAKFVRFSLQIGLFGAGSYLYIHGEILAGAIIAASILMGRALAPVESAIGTWKAMIGAKAAYQRLNAVFSSDRFRRFRDRMALPRPSGRVELDRVVVMPPRSERLILKGVSLKLNAGQFLGVIGPSGAGKSTLAKVLVGIITPRGGAGARLDGAELGTWHPDDLGQYIGYLPQDVQLFPGTVRENVSRLAMDADPDAVIEAAKRAGVHEMILSLPDGYDSDIGEAGRLLSAGQRQQIGLARAFYGDPVVLVLDEPNSNLDAVSEDALSRALAKAKGRGTTIIVITHRPSVLQASDQLLVLKDGSVDMYGPTADVMDRMRQGTLAQEPRKKMPAAREAEPAVSDGRGDARPRAALESARRDPAQRRKRSDRGQARSANGGRRSASQRDVAGAPEAPRAAKGNGQSRDPGDSRAVDAARPANEPPPATQAEPARAPFTFESSIVRAENLMKKG